MSIALAKKGLALRVHGRDATRVGKVVDECRSLGSDASGFVFDFDEEHDWPIEDMIRGVDTLVVAYGPLLDGPLEAVGPADWIQVTVKNLALPGALVSAAVASMRIHGYGRILLFGTARSDMIAGFKSVAPYAAAKTGLGVIARSVQVDDDTDVTCNVVCPGYVKTEYYSPEEVQRLESLYGPLPDPGVLVSHCLPFLLSENRQTGAIVPIYREYGPWSKV